MITLIIPRKRYKGISESGKTHRFVLSGHGKHWYFIPVKYLKSMVYFESDKTGETLLKAGIDKDALTAYGTGDDLTWCLTVIKRQEHIDEQVLNLLEDEEGETNH